MSKKRHASALETAVLLIMVIGMTAVAFAVLAWIGIEAWKQYGWP